MKCLNKSNLCGIVFPHGTIIIPRKEFDQVTPSPHTIVKTCAKLHSYPHET